MRRIFRRTVWLLAAALVTGAGVGAQPAPPTGQAGKDFEELFGRQIREGKGTRSAGDDVALARRICEAAQGAAGDDALLTLMCQNAAQLAAPHAEGLDVAAEALQMLTRRVPARADECRRQLLDIQMRRFAVAQGTLKMRLGEQCVVELMEMADEKAAARRANEATNLLRQAERIAQQNRSDTVRLVQTRLQEVELAEAARGRVEPLRARVAADPRDGSAREKLIVLHLLELDDPAEAAKSLTPDSDQAMRTYIPLAAGADKGLSEAVCLELAQWYAGLSGAGKGGKGGELTSLKRAKRYYEAYLKKHVTKDAAQLKAQGELAKVAASLEALGPRPATDWTGILRLVDVEKHSRWGTWGRAGTAVATTKKSDNSRVTVPVCPEGSYELRGRFTRQEGTGGVRLVLPIRQTSCTLVLGDGKDGLTGLERVGGKDLRQADSTTEDVALHAGVPHALCVKVVTTGDRVAVTASLDDKEVFRWKGAQDSLARPKDWDTTNPDALALGADHCLVSFASLDIRMLSGTITTVTVDEHKARAAHEERLRRERERAAKAANPGNNDPPPKKKKKNTGK